MTDLYLTTSIPYVNGAPHLGHALELVHADVLARHRRRRGGLARLQSGTDDHALKNVAAAHAAGEPVRPFVTRHARRFEALVAALGVDVDAFVSTSADVRHPRAVRGLWESCERAGDLYRSDYVGLYCAGCEQFNESSELVGGRICPEHGTTVHQVAERNWFFRLSRYREPISRLIETREVEIVPEVRRNEVLGFLRGPVQDLSVSRPAERAAGWGLPVPGDPDQVIYVWFDALVNYLTGLGYGTECASDVDRWWSADVERTHLVGKGIARFHAVHWIAFLLSAGLLPPSRVLIHDYLTVDGRKIAKSGPPTADPAHLVDELGVDALRWWLVREPVLVGTSDFSEESVRAVHDRDLANGLGNLVARVSSLADRAGRRDLLRDRGTDGADRELGRDIDTALEAYDLRAAAVAITSTVDRANRRLDNAAPWRLVSDVLSGNPAATTAFEDVISSVTATCRSVAFELTAFVPEGAARVVRCLDGRDESPIFPRLLSGRAS